MLTWDEIQSKAITFSKRWENAKREQAEKQPFLLDFFRVFGLDDVLQMDGCSFEYEVRKNNNVYNWIDFFWKGQIAIEMKTRGKDLGDAYTQLKGYMDRIPSDEVPDLWVVCDFNTFQIWRHSTKEKATFKLKDLRKNIKRFANIAGYSTERTRETQVEVDIKAAEKMAKLHDALRAHGYDGHELEVYLCRLLFCMFADDTGIFAQDSFYYYVSNSKSDGSDLSDRIARLFEILNSSQEVRAKKTLLSDELRQFQYINGGLFQDRLPPADFNAKMHNTLIDCISFDWSKISPAIFGAMFQGVMDKEMRRKLGAHYTSEENILKLINPLFMEALWSEFEKVKTSPTALDRFHEKISSLKFLDPACGCGNFLIITYRELRKLELEILKMKINTKQLIFDITSMLKVNVGQFYGIEFEDFPCQVATVGMWLIDHQMNLRVSEQFGTYYARLPLTQSATIVHGNALRLDWESIIPKTELSYILGNPPFAGARLMTSEQKNDLLLTFGKNYQGVGKLDYVSSWYKKSAELIKNTTIKCAFISTNSIIQGEQKALLFKPMHYNGIAHTVLEKSFKWYNEAKGKAAVFCIIVKIENNQNQQLFVDPAPKPLSNVAKLSYGSFALDNGHFTISAKEYNEILQTDKNAEQFLRPFIGAKELLHNKKRYCVWLQGANPSAIKSSHLIMQKIQAVKAWRSQSKRKNTEMLANTPTLFAEIRQPSTDYLAIPTVSSEKRKYLPMAFLSPNVIASNQIYVLPQATLYHFGILTSSVHNAWTRAVAGRLKSDIRYSNNIVYNNFPWPSVNEKQKTEIELLAQAVLDARALYPNCSLADLYDALTMPVELYNAHKKLDRAVMQLYGLSFEHTTESDCVAELMKLYNDLAIETK